jgi:hypothetical protein
MSPEWNIDASTCAFPFRTWFVKGMSHTENTGDYNSFSNDIIYNDLDVFSDPNRPQFLKTSDDGADKLVPITAPEEKEETAYEKFFAILRMIVLFPKTIFEKLFGGLFK